MSFVSFSSKFEVCEGTPTITKEEGYALTEKYVTYYLLHDEKFAYLRTKIALEDVIGDMYLHFLEKGFFEKYNSKITTKKYFTAVAVKRRLIDMSRKEKETISLSTPIGEEEGTTLEDIIADDKNYMEKAETDLTRDRVLSILDDDGSDSVEIDSPVRGFVKFSLREIALHLELGYTPQEIAGFSLKKKTRQPITAATVYNKIRQMRELCQNLYEPSF